MSRATLVLVLLLAALVGGCGLQLAPYDARLSCQGVGGSYGADGRCHVGSGA